MWPFLKNHVRFTPLYHHVRNPRDRSIQLGLDCKSPPDDALFFGFKVSNAKCTCVVELLIPNPKNPNEVWCGCVLTRLWPLGSLFSTFSKPFDPLPSSLMSLGRSIGFTMTKISCFLILFVFVSLSNVHGLKVPFQQRAPRGASMTSPRSASRYRFGATYSEAVVNRRDIRVTIFFNAQYSC